MKIRRILDTKGRDVVTAAPGDTVVDAIHVLVEHDIGAVVVVTPEGRVEGILSERDILRLADTGPETLGERRVEEVMTTDVITGSPDDSMDQVMEVMTRNRIRHLPILEKGELRGIVSIGDVVNACRKEVETENRQLRNYIHTAGA